MGTWAVDSFGNDDASDWVGDLEERRDLALAEDAVQRVLAAGSGYLEAPDAAQALVAAEVIAAALGRPSAAVNKHDHLVEWIAKVKPNPSPALAANARTAIDRILAADSELNELWRESDEYDSWVQGVRGLQQRLGA